MKNVAEIEYTFVKTVEFTDEEMREHGYEGEITRDMKQEYVNNLLEEELEKNLNTYHFTSMDLTDIYFSSLWKENIE